MAGRIAGVTDPDGNPITLTINGITQDEPVNSTADGNTSPDATIGSGGAFQVRAERSGQGDGRVYRVAFTATDGLGGECSGVGPHRCSARPGRPAGSDRLGTAVLRLDASVVVAVPEGPRGDAGPSYGRIAARMTSTGAGSPVQSSKDAAP